MQGVRCRNRDDVEVVTGHEILPVVGDDLEVVQAAELLEASSLLARHRDEARFWQVAVDQGMHAAESETDDADAQFNRGQGGAHGAFRVDNGGGRFIMIVRPIV